MILICNSTWKSINIISNFPFIYLCFCRGIITEDSQGTYVQFKFVEAMKKNPWFEWDNAPQPDWCVVAVDPNVGGSIQPDETAFIALVACRGQIVVCHCPCCCCCIIVSMTSVSGLNPTVSPNSVRIAMAKPGTSNAPFSMSSHILSNAELLVK